MKAVIILAVSSIIFIGCKKEKDKVSPLVPLTGKFDLSSSTGMDGYISYNADNGNTIEFIRDSFYVYTKTDTLLAGSFAVKYYSDDYNANVAAITTNYNSQVSTSGYELNGDTLIFKPLASPFQEGTYYTYLRHNVNR